MPSSLCLFPWCARQRQRGEASRTSGTGSGSMSAGSSSRDHLRPGREQRAGPLGRACRHGHYDVPVGRLLLAFILIPVVELFLLIEIGRRIGTLPTLVLIVATGVLGAWLVRLQGLSVLRKVQAEMAVGRMPAGAMVDGIIILIAGAVLMTPGVLTDALEGEVPSDRGMTGVGKAGVRPGGDPCNNASRQVSARDSVRGGRGRRRG